jgi:hypothetical protein
MGLWWQGNSIEVRCWVSNIYYQIGVMKKLSIWKSNKISTKFYPRTFKSKGKEERSMGIHTNQILMWEDVG